MDLVYIDSSEFKEKVYTDYLAIFPEDERKPIEWLETSFQKGYIEFIKIIEKDNLVGFMILQKVQENGYLGLDYFAILPAYRNQGLGSKALEMLIQKETRKKGIFVEIEKVGLGKNETENEQREKRQRFYQKLGFQKLNCDLQLFDVIYTLHLFSHLQEEEEDVIREIWQIYETVSGKKRIQENCKIFPYLKFEELTKENIKTAARVEYEIFPKSSAYSVYKAKVTGERNDFYVSYIAYFEEKPIGVIGLYELPGYPDTVWLSWFGLIEEYRKMGFGKQMWDFIVEIAKKKQRKFLRLYTFEIDNAEAQKFYKRNMDLEEYYFNEKEHQDIFQGKPKIFSKSLCDKKVEPWNNKFVNISEDEDSHEKSVLMMKQDGIL